MRHQNRWTVAAVLVMSVLVSSCAPANDSSAPVTVTSTTTAAPSTSGDAQPPATTGEPGQPAASISAAGGARPPTNIPMEKV